MIHGLRRKLVTALMAVVCLFVAGILAAALLGLQSSYQHRFPDDRPRPERDNVMPIAVVTLSRGGAVDVLDNRIAYLAESDLTGYVSELEQGDADDGVVGPDEVRYSRRSLDDGTVRYFFADTTLERAALRRQTLYSVLAGLGAVALFFGVSLLIARWITRPVEQAWARQRQFVADASHELKTPLTVVLSNADMLLASGAVAGEKNRNRLDNIRAESQRMRGLVESLLTLARSDAGAEPPPRELVDFSFVAESAALTLEPVIYDAGRSLETDIESGLTVRGDAGALRRLCDILLDNACKYGDEGSVVRVRLQSAGRREALLEVESAGAPLSPEECGRIFERFYRADSSRGERGGYGLGLSIAQSIARRHGGRLWAQSDGARRNVFSFRLPCA
ncbi:MAG: HAMP domain-containing sensor histidine kinase [Eubacteriales bacterium]|nr:HAMP domain-containing sensor histidine kinase [Eubacteriales bacterium]